MNGIRLVDPTKIEFAAAVNAIWDAFGLGDKTESKHRFLIGDHICNVTMEAENFTIEIFTTTQDREQDRHVLALKFCTSGYVFHMPALVDMVSLAIALEGWDEKFKPREKIAA